MKFWCASSNSSKQQKLSNKKMKKRNNSLSSSTASYATISSSEIPKSDSGYSETTSTYSYLQQILAFERIYYENLKHYITKYSRPLRRYLNPDELVHLFQNIEKISTISESLIRQYQKLLATDINSDTIYPSWSDVMVDSYNSYISRSIQAQATLKQCENKIAYFLQIPIEVVTQEITEFILLPLRHIYTLNDLFRHYDLMNVIEDVSLLSKQANCILQLSCNDQISIVELSPIMVFQRTDNEPWESKRLELSDSRLSFTKLDQSSINTSICLSHVVHIEEDSSNEELRLIVASTMRKLSRYSSVQMQCVYIRFEDKNDYCMWLNYLTNAIQDAKDQSWSQTNELVI